jgi:XRE family transcriptional regulator, fatty acid utilization regulator
MSSLLGIRLKALREERKLSQDDLARLFGFRDRQTVSAIETGERRLSVEELLTAIDKLGTSLEYFTDPFQLIGEGEFSWRHSGLSTARLDAFEQKVGRWIALYRTSAQQVGRNFPLLRRTLGLTARHSPDDAAAAGERFATEFDLGQAPASHLAEAMQSELGMLVLMVDAPAGVSGAACRLPAFDTVLVNRQQEPGQRHFELAHELFHVLTWDAMPPARVEDASEPGKSRVEQLAHSFASALLMPAAVVSRFGPWDDDLAHRLNGAANVLSVPLAALKSRLVQLGWLDRETARQVREASPSKPATRPLTRRVSLDLSPPSVAAVAPLASFTLPSFSRPFVEVIALAIREGRLSVRRAVDLLDLTIEDLADLCTMHGIETPFDL